LFINRSNATVCELQLLGSGSEAIAIMKKITEPLCEPTTSGLNYDWVEPASPSGTARPLQVIRRSDKTVVDYTGTVFTDTFLNRRDAGFPFRDAPTIGLLNDDGDDPNMGLDKNPVSASWSTSMSTWLLWKSDRANSIWIPATNINFGWEMAAVRGARGEPWTPTVLEPSSFGEYRPAGDLYGSFPEWTGVH